MSPLHRIVQGLRLADAKILNDPKADAKWRRVLEQRERDRERREWDDLVRRMNGGEE